LKTLGFSDFMVIALVFTEAAIPCLIGAALGLGLAAAFAQQIPPLMPPEVYLPAPTMPASLLGLALASALLMALFSAAIPALRLRRLDVASALAGK
jgi:putative ABC transport system permease protein